MNIPHVQKISSRPFQQFSKRCEVRLGQIASGISRSTEEKQHELKRRRSAAAPDKKSNVDHTRRVGPSSPAAGHEL